MSDKFIQSAHSMVYEKDRQRKIQRVSRLKLYKFLVKYKINIIIT